MIDFLNPTKNITSLSVLTSDLDSSSSFHPWEALSDCSFTECGLKKAFLANQSIVKCIKYKIKIDSMQKLTVFLLAIALSSVQAQEETTN